MKKLSLLLGLLVVGLLLVSCGPAFEEKGVESGDGEEDQGLAGEAVYVGGKWVRVICEQFGSSSADDEMTGYRFCRNEGFDTCEGISAKVETKFYSSTDKSCSGEVQSIFFSFPEMPCDSELGLNPLDESEGYGCNTYTSNPNAGEIVIEPASGDVKISEKSQYVNCCKVVG